MPRNKPHLLPWTFVVLAALASALALRAEDTSVGAAMPDEAPRAEDAPAAHPLEAVAAPPREAEAGYTEVPGSRAPAQMRGAEAGRPGDVARARAHPEEYVGGNPWWPRARGRRIERTALRAGAEPVRYGPADVVLEDDGLHHRAKDAGERRDWLDGLTASGDDHGFGRKPRAASPSPVEAPARKPPSKRIVLDLRVETRPADARVTANGYALRDGGLSMTLPVPGDLEIVATAPGRAKVVRLIRLGADHPGGRHEVRIELPIDAEAGSASASASAAPAAAPAGR